jgi:hypothetical protein
MAAITMWTEQIMRRRPTTVSELQISIIVLRPIVPPKMLVKKNPMGIPA